LSITLRTIFDYFGAHASAQWEAHERGRARQRIAISVLSAVATAAAALWVEPDPSMAWVAAGLCVAYSLAGVLQRRVTFRHGEANVAMTYVFLVADSMVTVVTLAAAPRMLAPLFPVLMVQIMRVGLRYGVRSMMLSWASAALASVVLLRSSFWTERTYLPLSYLTMMIIIPVLFGPLVRTLLGVTEELRSAAGSDPLTGLGNRRMLDEHLRVAQARCREDGTMLALVVIDLDNFKVVNDTYGHATGDRLLQEIADTLRANFRATDIVARVGGDEFVILIEGLHAATGRRHADALAAGLVMRIEATAEDVAPGAGVSASVGVKVWAHGAGPVTAGSDLLDEADRAMYDAKRAGRRTRDDSPTAVARPLD
jgi:diguanylate cyclase (GGDEF)-like protein